jgi:hypothetical protein
MEEANAYVEIANRHLHLRAREVSQGNYSADLFIDGVPVLGTEGRDAMEDTLQPDTLESAKEDAESQLRAYLSLHKREWPADLKIEWK